MLLAADLPDTPDAETAQRLIRAAVKLFQVNGYHATGVADILTEACAPKGSLYHHFPGGKADLGAHAARWLCGEIVAAIGKARTKGLAADTFMARLATDTAQWLADRNWRQGTLLAMLADETVPDERVVAEAVRDSYRAIIDALAALYADSGLSPRKARARALASLAGLNGATTLSRALQDREPLETFARALQPGGQRRA